MFSQCQIWNCGNNYQTFSWLIFRHILPNTVLFTKKGSVETLFHIICDGRLIVGKTFFFLVNINLEAWKIKALLWFSKYLYFFMLCRKQYNSCITVSPVIISYINLFKEVKFSLFSGRFYHSASTRGCPGRGVVVRVHAPSALIRERLFDVCKRLFEVREWLFGALRFALALKKRPPT